MNIGERILLSLSKEITDDDHAIDTKEETSDGALELLNKVYPDLGSLVSGANIVDFGCGLGYQSVALVRNFGCSVVGVDSNLRTLECARNNAKNANISSQQLHFVEKISPDMLSSYDIVISQNSFEHFTDPKSVLYEMSSLLKPSGKLLITFGPPWYAPYGSHMQFFCRVPWINVLFPEKVVMGVRSHFRNDGAKIYEDVESGLNKMSIAKFESIITSCGLKVAHKQYECVKGINWLSNIPILRELFINHVTVILLRGK